MSEEDRMYLDCYAMGARGFWRDEQLLGRQDHLEMSIGLTSQWRAAPSAYADAHIDAFGGRPR